MDAAAHDQTMFGGNWNTQQQQQQQPTGLFGQPAATAPAAGGFGQPAGGFGQPAAGGMFGGGGGFGECADGTAWGNCCARGRRIAAWTERDANPTPRMP